jgi:metal-responsive CopG/Arc/MetJ family transcriptional regulator
MEKVMLTLPTDLLHEVDALARQTKKNRSQFMRHILREWIEAQHKKEFETFLAEGYQEMAQQNTALVEESLPVQVAAIEGWHWDE